MEAMRKSRWSFFGAVVFLMLGLTGVAQAQNTFGSIFGTVTDATGSAVANATVLITETTKETATTAVTNETGNYNKGQLIPGTYRVSITAPGFSKVVSNDIIVQVDAAAKFDAALQVGDVSQQIDVTAAAPLLQSDRADVAQTLTQQQINDLPNIGRNLQSFELLNPGTAKLPWQHASDENPQGSIQLVTNGQLFDSQGYVLDGTTNQDPILGIIIINPTIDSISEVKQANQDFDSEFEYTGAGLAIYSTKSGANAFHGDAFEYLQVNTPGFQDFARDPFSQNTSAGVPTYRENQFGGSIGGRVIKDKLFFFADTQLTRESQGGSKTVSVPTAEERMGNFSDWLAAGSNVTIAPGQVINQYQIFDPTTGNQTTGQGRTPFPGNIIPPSKLSPQALALLNYFPLPNYSGNGTLYTNNYEGSGATAITGNSWNTRWDYYLNQKNSIFGRYSYAAYTESAPGLFGLEAGGPQPVNYSGDSQALNQNLAIGWTDTISPTLVNEVRFGYVRYHVNDVPNGYGTDPATAAGIPGLNLDKTYTSGLPAFNINNPTGASEQIGYALSVNQCNCPLTQLESQYQLIDNITKVRGNHSIKLGTDLRYALNLRVPSDSHRAGELAFNSSATGIVPDGGGGTAGGLGIASFILGDVSSFQRYVSSTTDAAERQKRFFFYGQDEWRVSPKLTFTYGARWEMIFPETVNAAGNGATYDLSNNLLYVFGVGGVSSHGIQSMNWHTMEPRIGLAYQLNSKTVIRSGYGWAYDLGTFGSTFGHNVTQNPPVLSNQTLSPSGSFDSVFTLANGPPAPTPVVVSANGTAELPNGINPKFRPSTVTLPTVYQYNLAVQRQLTNKVAVTAAYVGNATRHGFLGTSNNVNVNEAPFIPGAANPQFNQPYYIKYGLTQGLSYYCDCSNEMYNSLQVTFKVDRTAGYTLQGSYTYQRSYGQGWGPYDPNYYFLYDRSAGEGYNSNLPRNQLTMLQNYDIPFGHGRKYGSTLPRALDLAVGGWNVSGITTFYSGLPFDPTLESGYPGDPNTGPNNRPDDGTVSPYAGAQGNRNQWFVGESLAQLEAGNSGPWALPAANTFGTHGIGTLFGPHFIQQDISLKKDFHITERVGLTFRTDATNMFNHTNLGLPNGDINSPQAGQITSTAFGGNNMRRLQYSATVHF